MLGRASGHSETAMSDIDAKYLQMGGAGSTLGAPTSAEAATADGVGRYRHYQHGSIFWHPASGSRAVHGRIHERSKAILTCGG